MSDEARREETAAEAEEREAAEKVIDDLGQLRAKADERDKFLEMLQRTKADFDNYQKRIHRDMEQERKYAQGPLARDLLPALDNLERALASVKGENTLSQGIRMVQTQLLEVLKRHHITPIDALDRPFDPHLHQAVMQQPARDKPPNTVIQVLESGYMHHDRVLRPARVIVSKGTE